MQFSEDKTYLGDSIFFSGTSLLPVSQVSWYRRDWSGFIVSRDSFQCENDRWENKAIRIRSGSVCYCQTQEQLFKCVVQEIGLNPYKTLICDVCKFRISAKRRGTKRELESVPELSLINSWRGRTSLPALCLLIPWMGTFLNEVARCEHLWKTWLEWMERF